MANRKAGRPTVAQSIYGDNAAVMDAIWAGASFNTKRSTADYVYSTIALRIISEAASEIPHIEAICRIGGNKPWYSRSIFSQLGRMSAQDGYSDSDVIAVARVAAEARHNGCMIKQLEGYIRKVRIAGQW